MDRFFRIIALGIALFFPYMPIIHGGEVFSVSRCPSAHEHRVHTDHHDMNLCREIVREILVTPSYTDIGEISLVYVWQQFPHLLIPLHGLSQKNLTYHPLEDPPYFAPHDLIGIVILTT